MTVQSHRESLRTFALVHEAVNQMDEGISVVDDHLKIIFFNDRFVELLQYPAGLVRVGGNLEDLLQFRAERGDFGEGEIDTLVREGLERAMRIETDKTEWVRADGAIIEIIGNGMPTGGFIAVYTDITELRKANEEIRLAAEVLANANESVVICNADNVIESVNPAFERYTGYGAADVIGKKPGVFMRSDRHDPEYYQQIWNALRDKGRWQGDLWYNHREGREYAAHLSITTLRNGAGEVTNYVSIGNDITERKLREQRIWRQANFDGLTGLPNREMFLARLSEAIERARTDGTSFAAMFIDLDGFKAINDTMGHAAGDVLLKEAAERIKGSLRATDIVARLQGDEFTVLVENLTEPDHAETVAEKVRAALSADFTLNGTVVAVRGSIGVAIYPGGGDTADEILGQADKAMYGAKKAGKNMVRIAAGDGPDADLDLSGHKPKTRGSGKKRRGERLRLKW